MRTSKEPELTLITSVNSQIQNFLVPLYFQAVPFAVYNYEEYLACTCRLFCMFEPKGSLHKEHSHYKQRYFAAWFWEEKAARNLPFIKRLVLQRAAGTGN